MKGFLRYKLRKKYHPLPFMELFFFSIPHQKFSSLRRYNNYIYIKKWDDTTRKFLRKFLREKTDCSGGGSREKIVPVETKGCFLSVFYISENPFAVDGTLVPMFPMEHHRFRWNFSNKYKKRILRKMTGTIWQFVFSRHLFKIFLDKIINRFGYNIPIMIGSPREITIHYEMNFIVHIRSPQKMQIPSSSMECLHISLSLPVLAASRTCLNSRSWWKSYPS